LFYECNHPLEFVGDLFIAEAVRIGHDVVEQGRRLLWLQISVQSVSQDLNRSQSERNSA
jgi:hypothetical protein